MNLIYSAISLVEIAMVSISFIDPSKYRIIRDATVLWVLRQMIRSLDLEQTREFFSEEDWGVFITLQTGSAIFLSINMINCFDMTDTLTKILCIVSWELCIMMGFFGHLGSW
jgi:hypothetical protein